MTVPDAETESVRARSAEIGPSFLYSEGKSIPPPPGLFASIFPLPSFPPFGHSELGITEKDKSALVRVALDQFETEMEQDEQNETG
jgi:hypothetical protein